MAILLFLIQLSLYISIDRLINGFNGFKLSIIFMEYLIGTLDLIITTDVTFFRTIMLVTYFYFIFCAEITEIY